MIIDLHLTIAVKILTFALLLLYKTTFISVNGLSETCPLPSMKESEARILNGARYGASETSHSRLNFARPGPDYKQ